ncbi:MAG: aminotransferase [Parasphingopyxis sp.]
MNPFFAELPTSIFAEMSELASRHDAINLGQGFPDGEGPEDVRRAAAEASISGYNQYAPMRGMPALREAIAKHYAHHQALEIDPEREILVTAGATEALASTILAGVAEGDEVILLQPAYDAYAPLIRRAGGTPVFVTLEPPDWRVTAELLESAVTDRTSAIVVNSPLNPAAAMLGDGELALLARFCIEHDLIAICDEVWEHIAFDGRAHRSLITEPGMRERAVKIGSAGKIFSLTGWKTGWAIADPSLIEVIAKAHQYLTFATPPNLQNAVAYGLGKDDAYFTGMRADYQASRDRLAKRLDEAGFAVLPTEATYFLSVDLARSGVAMSDREFCLAAPEQAGVAAIPVSAFYEADPVDTVIRLCFAKADDILDEAAERLGRFRQRLVGENG